jgi:hypothetical protein
MDEKPRLIAAKDRHGRFSGYYKCSHCPAEFRPNLQNPAELWNFFASHVQLKHATNKTTPASPTKDTD